MTVPAISREHSGRNTERKDKADDGTLRATNVCKRETGEGIDGER